MNTGCQRHIRSARFSLGFFVLLLLAGSVMAQTPDATCVNDSLFLISPEAIDLRLNNVGRHGIEVSWPNLDPTQATCFALMVPDSIEAEIFSSGEFTDSVDRVFHFMVADSGGIGSAPMAENLDAIGGMEPRSLRVNWNNLGPVTNGVYEGSFNLANNGGFLRLNGGVGGEWETFNQSLPVSWYQVNVMAIAEGRDGVFVAGLSGGSVPDVDSKGVFINRGDGWDVLNDSYFPNLMNITSIEISPNDNNFIAVGTGREGLWISQDGGASFTQWTYAFDPDNPELPLAYNVSALLWTSEKLIVALPNFGVFASEDNGSSFVKVDFEVKYDLDLEAEVYVLPVVNHFTVDPNDINHILAALSFHGVWESRDGGFTWTDLYGDLNVPAENIPGAWVYSALQVIVDASDPQIILMGCEQRGIYRTTDAGLTWVLVGESAQPETTAILNSFAFAQKSSTPGEFLAFEDKWGLIYSTDYGASWDVYPTQPDMNRGYRLISTQNGQDYLLGTTYGGIYEIGSSEIGPSFSLSTTYTSGTWSMLRDVDIGVELAFSRGVLDELNAFDLVCQTFQGWAVWRSHSYDMNNMTLLGLYDMVNPEDCIEGYCGDLSYEVLPICFAAKKAACFNFENSDTTRFFDQEVYEGFSYQYAVTSFDYGNTALTSAESNTNEMVFSPRWYDDTNSPYIGSGNRTGFVVNSVAQDPVTGEGIYVYPNPLREGAGVPGGEGEAVIFTNLPIGSRVRVFTTSGDDVINLGPDAQVGRNIRWNTRNRESERISAGVYLYKIEMPQREDYWGRLVVIR